MYTKWCSGSQGIISKDSGIVTYVSPKCGMTTMKHLSGCTYGRTTFGVGESLMFLKKQPEYKTDKSQAGIKLAVIRDPVERFISGYKHVVVKKGDLAPILSNTPTFSEFIENFDTYDLGLKSLDPTAPNIQIEFHFSPQVNCIGNDPTKFNYIFNIETQQEEIFGLFDTTYNTSFERVKLNYTSEPVVAPTAGEVAWIQNKYAIDYETYF